jgi:hypothetical protein
MPKYSIEETCSCGAKMEYHEDISKEEVQRVSDRQRAFHGAHACCRQVVCGHDDKFTTPPHKVEVE